MGVFLALSSRVSSITCHSKSSLHRLTPKRNMLGVSTLPVAENYRPWEFASSNHARARGHVRPRCWLRIHPVVRVFMRTPYALVQCQKCHARRTFGRQGNARVIVIQLLRGVNAGSTMSTEYPPLRSLGESRVECVHAVDRHGAWRRSIEVLMASQPVILWSPSPSSACAVGRPSSAREAFSRAMRVCKSSISSS